MPLTAGELISQTLAYDGGRGVTAYVPAQPSRGVVFAADGGWHVAGLAEALEANGETSTLVVGVHGSEDDERRLEEYSPGFDPERFAAHERFFVEEVGAWVRSVLGVRLPRERTALWGASAGGELAIALALRHPDAFGTVLCASPGGGYQPTGPFPPALPRCYFVGGSEEPWFFDNARRWAVALEAAGAEVVLRECEGGHGGLWHEAFPHMVSWAWPRPT